MDTLRYTLAQIRDGDTRSRSARIASAWRRVNSLVVDVDGPAAGDVAGRCRRAAAHLVVDALAVLAACDGDGGDVTTAAGDLLGGDRSAEAPPGRRNHPATVHDTTAEPDPHLGPVSSGDPAGPAGVDDPDPGRYPDGPAGDHLAWADLEYTADD